MPLHEDVPYLVAWASSSSQGTSRCVGGKKPLVLLAYVLATLHVVAVLLRGPLRMARLPRVFVGSKHAVLVVVGAPTVNGSTRAFDVFVVLAVIAVVGQGCPFRSNGNLQQWEPLW